MNFVIHAYSNVELQAHLCRLLMDDVTNRQLQLQTRITGRYIYTSVHVVGRLEDTLGRSYVRA